IRFQLTVFQIWPCSGQAAEGIADCLGERRFSRESRQLGVKPGHQIVEDRLCLILAPCHPSLGRLTTDLLFDGVKLRNPADGFCGYGRSLRGNDIDELAPDMGHAGHLAGLVAAKYAVESGITVGMNPTRITEQMALGMLSLAVEGEL